ncbi:glycoside hydrolase family 61 protein [Roridomyces roridus]|uniref:AA9 family lytic polysaccharide monooxygenase n=1 Tax=Roridomyces roridus TaxID=1738132 RepID=A0AAD7B0D1_9AGAR|nr:glycoside hydrolase family 61 protein [Roridomyces roridus]
MGFSTFIFPLLFIPYVSAHGFVHKVWIGTETFLGNTPNAEPTSSIVRQIDDVDPVKGANNTNLNCGQDAQFASNITEANPGDPMSFLWTGGDLSIWPHNVGPMLWYMTSCGDTDCTTFNSSQAEWFKVAQVGRISGDPDGNWYQGLIRTSSNMLLAAADWILDDAAGVPANMTLPTNILPGAYLIRHEIIALHLATDLGGAEFYPSCTQIRITGNGNGKPTSDEVVRFPGGYSDTDPGILVPDVYDDPPPPYAFPGPPIAAFVGAAPTPTTSAHAPPSTAPATASKICKLKRSSLTAGMSKRDLTESIRPSGHLTSLMRTLTLAFGGRSH